MSMKKSVFVTALLAVMLGIIIYAAYRLLFPAFVVIVGALAGVGFGSAAVAFCRWLCIERGPELPELTPVVIEEPVEEPVTEIDVDAIMREVSNAASS